MKGSRKDILARAIGAEQVNLALIVHTEQMRIESHTEQRRIRPLREKM